MSARSNKLGDCGGRFARRTACTEDLGGTQSEEGKACRGGNSVVIAVGREVGGGGRKYKGDKWLWKKIQ